MKALRPSWMLLAASAIVMAACSDDTTEPETSGPDYVLLLDDDSKPDQVQGEPGTYALTARGSGTPPLAVLDVPAGYSNFGFFALWRASCRRAAKARCWYRPESARPR